MENINEVFDKYRDEYLKFERVENKLSNRPDLHAFMLLDQLCPAKADSTEDLIVASEHDEYYLSICLDELSSVVTQEQVRDLVRCGVRYDYQNDGLCLFA